MTVLGSARRFMGGLATIARMTGKPRGWGSDYAAWFSLASVADRYALRPPYPAGTFDLLVSLVDPTNRSVLDAGCGTGELARSMVLRVDRVDAVDQSAAMLARGRELADGVSANLRWVLGAVEEATLSPAYGLIMCGDSIHWFDWSVAMARFRQCLTPRGHLVLLTRQWLHDPVIAEPLGPLYARHSANKDFLPLDPVTELEQRGLFERVGEQTMASVPWRPSLDELIGCHHSQNGFAWEKMDDPEGFDRELADQVTRNLAADHDGRYNLTYDTTVVWGRPAAA
jgi:SAM-dependent methyltransferase